MSSSLGHILRKLRLLGIGELCVFFWKGSSVFFITDSETLSAQLITVSGTSSFPFTKEDLSGNHLAIS
jgi:hypothetical protein